MSDERRYGDEHADRPTFTPATTKASKIRDQDLEKALDETLVQYGPALRELSGGSPVPTVREELAQVRAQLSAAHARIAELTKELDEYRAQAEIRMDCADLLRLPTGHDTMADIYAGIEKDHARIAALEAQMDEDVLAAYSRTDGHREWFSGGTWLYPGDKIVVINTTPPDPKGRD